MATIDINNTNHIFVFGSNTEGRHGKGAALYALQNFGAIYGNPRGIQGRSYAIITKNLNPKLGKFGKRSVSLPFISGQILRLKWFATQCPFLTFFVSKIGTGNAGYTDKEIKSLFDNWAPWPENVDLSEWKNTP